MSLSSNSTIDPSTLLPPKAIEELDFEAIYDRQTQAFLAFWDTVRAANPDADLPLYTVQSLETDPVGIVNQAESERELLLRAHINDTVRALLPAFAKGTDLDHIVARANVLRLPTEYDEDGNVVARESDRALLDRYLRAFAAPAAGSEDSYIFHARTAWPLAHDIRPLDYSAGTGLQKGDVEVILLAPNGQDPSDAAVDAVTRALSPRAHRPMTDVVSVRKATVDLWRLKAKLILPRGPSPMQVINERRAAAQAFADRRYFIGGLITLSGAVSALYSPNVTNVILQEPLADIPSGPDRAPFLTEIDLTYEVEGT